MNPIEILNQSKEVIVNLTPNSVRSIGRTALTLAVEVIDFAKQGIIVIANGYLKHEGYGYIEPPIKGKKDIDND